jgi:tol-pal system protein YbgF
MMASGGQPTAGQEIVASVRGAGTGSDPEAVSPSNVPANLTGSLYDEGVKAFNDGRYDDAIQSFRDFIHQQPQSAYADDAQFWIGESNVRKGEYNTAVKEFNQVVLRYGSGDRSAASLLKLAEVFSKMGDRVDARLSLQKLVNRYPGSTEAGQAYKMLQEMGG